MTLNLHPHQFAIDALCRRHGVRMLWLFGSAAQGAGESHFGPASDVDFLVEFETLPENGYADACFGLLEGLSALLGREVDLVVSSAIRNPYFRASVDATRIPVCAA